jgi:peptide subunit release factor 1 (eRF1)
VVICTDDNYSRLLQVADRPDIYAGHAKIDYNNQAGHQIAEQAWEIIKKQQTKREQAAIEEIKEAIGHNKAVTGLSEIYKAAKEGRGDLLLVQNDSSQAVKMTGDTTFELVDDITQPGVIDDITSEIAMEVILKKGRVVFTDLNELKGLGDVILKTRY